MGLCAVRVWRPLWLLALLVIMPACTPLHDCSAFGGVPGKTVQLFFGRSMGDGRGVSDAQWNAFAASVLTANFPDGFTVAQGEGQWRDPRSGRIVHEPSTIVLVAVPQDAGLAGRLRRVAAAYRARFDQQSVGQLISDSCGAF